MESCHIIFVSERTNKRHHHHLAGGARARGPPPFFPASRASSEWRLLFLKSYVFVTFQQFLTLSFSSRINIEPRAASRDWFRKDGNPLIEGCGGRRRMRDRLDAVERDGVQRQRASIVGWKKE